MLIPLVGAEIGAWGTVSIKAPIAFGLDSTLVPYTLVAVIFATTNIP